MAHAEPPVNERERRWSEEASFFDEAAQNAEVGPVDPRVIARYASRRRRRFSKEFRFRVIGNPAGLRILDLGCGDGENAMTLAKLGATVVGVDISPGAIDVCRQRAVANNVADRTRFVCSPVEQADLGSQFDVVWGDAILHHIIPDLASVLTRARECLAAGGRFVFAEPVDLFLALRRLRERLTAVETGGTSDERPLQRGELDQVTRVFPEARFRYFRMLSRLERLFLTDGPVVYESAGLGTRAAVNALAVVDSVALSLPVVQRLAGVVVIYGART